MNIKVSKLEWSGGSNRTDMDISRKETVSVAVSPENASNKNIEWSSESEPGDGEPGDVIELTPHGLSADVTAIGKGHAIIVAKSTDGSNLEIKYDIYVHWAEIYITTSNVEYESIVRGVEYDDDYGYDHRNLGLRGDVPWSEVNKEQLHFTCDKEGFEAVPEWKTDALGSDVGYVYLKGIGEQTPCAKYRVFYNNRKTEIGSIKCKNEDDLKDYGVYSNYFIELYSCKSWDEIKDELEYYGNKEQFSISYGEVNPEDKKYVAVLNILDGDSIVRKYKIDYTQLPTISYNSQYKDLGVSAIDITYDSRVNIDIHTSEQLDLQTVIKQLNFNCVDHPFYGFAESDGSDGGSDMYICDGDDYICNIYFRLIQE